MQPWVLRQVLEVGADQVADEDQVSVGAVAPGACLGRLDAAIYPLGEAIAEPGAEVFEDAVQMLFHGGRQPLERRQPAATGPAHPGAQQRLGLFDVAGTGEHLAQRLLEPPRPCSLQIRALQPVHLSNLLARPLGGVLERAPTNTFQVGLMLDLGAAYLIQRAVGQRDDVERIQTDLGIRAVLARAGLVGRTQVQTDVRDRPGIAAVRGQIPGESLEGGRILASCGEQQTARIHVAEHRQVAMPLVRAALVGADPAHRRVILALACRLDVEVQHAPHAVVRHAQQPRHRAHRHLRAQRNDEGPQRLRKARARPRPRRLHLRSLLAHPAPHPRHLRLDDGLVLEEVQVLPATRQAIVDGLIRRAAGRAGQSFGRVLDLEHDLALGLLKVDVDHAPWRGEPECLSEECFHRDSVPSTPYLPQGYCGVNHTGRERANIIG